MIEEEEGRDRVIDQGSRMNEGQEVEVRIYILFIRVASSLRVTFGLSLIINTRCKWRPFTFSLIWSTLCLCVRDCVSVCERSSLTWQRLLLFGVICHRVAFSRRTTLPQAIQRQ